MPKGVTTTKNTIPNTMGGTIEPKRIPNLDHSLFSGFKIFEFRIPKHKKIRDKARAHNFKSPWDIKGHNDIIKKTIKNSKPKLLFDDIFTVLFEFI